MEWRCFLCVCCFGSTHSWFGWVGLRNTHHQVRAPSEAPIFLADGGEMPRGRWTLIMDPSRIRGSRILGPRTIVDDTTQRQLLPQTLRLPRSGTFPLPCVYVVSEGERVSVKREGNKRASGESKHEDIPFQCCVVRVEWHQPTLPRSIDPPTKHQAPNATRTSARQWESRPSDGASLPFYWAFWPLVR